VVLFCDGASAGNIRNPGGITTLAYSGTGAAITFNTGGTNSGMRGCTLKGPGKNSSTIGLMIGGNLGFQLGHFEGNDIWGFGVGVQFGSNAYIVELSKNVIHDNGVNGTRNVYIPKGLTEIGENIHFSGGVITNHSAPFSTTCVEIDSPADISFDHVSFDQCGMTLNSKNVFARFTQNHWENPNGATTEPFLTIGAAANHVTVDIGDKEWLEDGTTGTRTEFIRNATEVPNAQITVNVYGGTFVPGETVAQLINSTGSACCSIANVYWYAFGFGGPQFSNVLGGTWYQSFVSDGSAIRLGANAGVTGAAKYVVCGGATNNPYLSCSYNGDGPFRVTRSVAAGTSTLARSAIGAGGCAPVVTVSAGNALPSDRIAWSYASAPSAADGKLILSVYSTANNVNFLLCNPTGGSISPSGLTINWVDLR